METKIIKFSGTDYRQKDIAAIGQMLRKGELAVIPTETVYGLAADGFSTDACHKLYDVKNRPHNKPVSLLLADVADLFSVAANIPKSARILAEKFMPGPLTLVIEKNSRVPNLIAGNGVTIGVRIPACDLTRAIIRSAGVPLATTSANLSGNPPPVDAKSAFNELAGKVTLIVDGGKTQIKVPSTVVDCTGDDLLVLRQGTISEAALLEACKNL